MDWGVVTDASSAAESADDQVAALMLLRRVYRRCGVQRRQSKPAVR
jgi:hypothetical protein